MLTYYSEIEDLLGSAPAKPLTVQPNKSDGISETMSESEIATFFGLVTSRVRTLARDGVMVKNGRGRFEVRKSLSNYLARLRDGAVKAGPQTDELKVEKLRLAKQQADKIELHNAASRGELVSSIDVEREWANVLRDIRSTLLAVPSRVGSKLAHLSAHDVSEIESEIKAALEGLANGD